jgi:hypothetical protein
MMRAWGLECGAIWSAAKAGPANAVASRISINRRNIGVLQIYEN